MKLWKRFYAKLRADVTASLATGGLGVAALYVLDATGLFATEPETKAAIATGAGWLGGKVAAYLKYETGPVVVAPTPPTPDGGR